MSGGWVYSLSYRSAQSWLILGGVWGILCGLGDPFREGGFSKVGGWVGFGLGKSVPTLPQGHAMHIED